MRLKTKWKGKGRRRGDACILVGLTTLTVIWKALELRGVDASRREESDLDPISCAVGLLNVISLAIPC